MIAPVSELLWRIRIHKRTHNKTKQNQTVCLFWLCDILC